MSTDPKIEVIENKVSEVVPSEQPKSEVKADSIVSEGKEENVQDRNWKKFREERELERKAKIEAEKRFASKEAEALALKAALDALIAKPQAQTYQQQDDVEESEEARIDKRVQQALDRERRKNEEERISREARDLPHMLQKTFGDFKSVCSTENLDYLEYHYPEVVAGYNGTPETFDKWANIYRACKRFIPNTDSRKDEKRIEKNLSKPQSMSQGGYTQTGDVAPTELTESRRQANWERMQRTLKGL